jgi:LPXTG-site transpeptidase (sortase) family protein
LQAWGYEGWLVPRADTAPEASANQVQYIHPGLTEWFINGPLGLQQGFTVSRQPALGSGPLTVQLGLPEGVHPQIGEQRTSLIFFDQAEQPVLAYGGLLAWDADGQSLPAELEIQGSSLLILVEDENANYPITIDPWAQQAKLTASDITDGDEFGWAVAMDGDTVVVGAHKFGQAGTPDPSSMGAAYVFIEPVGGWAATSTFNAKLTASDGLIFDEFGTSVAIDGDTIVVGTIGDDNDAGSAYVFVRPGGGWAGTLTETAKLTASGTYRHDDDKFGTSVAISGDTIVVGAPFDEIPLDWTNGLAYIFQEPGGGWSGTITEDAVLQPDYTGIQVDGAEFGTSVTISGDTVAAGAPGVDLNASNSGLAYIFEKPAGGWSGVLNEDAYLHPKAPAADNNEYADFGQSLDLNGDVLVVGAPGDTVIRTDYGEVYVFEKGAGWSTGAGNRVAELDASTIASGYRFGYSVSIDGDVIVVGAPGVNGMYIFDKRSGCNWVDMTESQRLTSSDAASGDQFGRSVSVSGGAVVAGAPFQDNGGTSSANYGAAYVFEASAAAEMEVSGNNICIPDGDTTPDTADHTDFGDVNQGSNFERTFTIHNDGSAVLNLTGTAPNYVTLTGSTDFSVSAQPASSSIAASGSTTFTVRCAPTGSGARTTTVTIANDDSDENPYNFDIKCTGINTRTLTVDGTGSGTGSTTDGGSISCTSTAGTDTGTCSDTVADGTVVTLTATASAGSVFTGWAGCDATAGNVCTQTVSGGNETVQPNFELERTLTVDGTGGGNGTTADGSSISCSSTAGTDTGTCSDAVADSTVVTLTATASAGSVFTGWAGCDAAAGNVCTQTVSGGNETVQPNFELERTLTLDGTGGGNGTTADGSSISCTSTAGTDTGTCSDTVADGTVVTLTATANAGSAFTGWSGCDSEAANVCTQTVSGGSETVQPNFELQRTLSVDSLGLGNGSTSGTAPSTISCTSTAGTDSGTCSEVVTDGTVVTLTANAASGSSFGGWTGCDSAAANVCTQTVSGGNETVQPEFTAPEIDVEGNGTSIANTDSTPDSTDHTNFGDVSQGSSFDRTFTIQNEGSATLSLDDHPNAVALSGSTDFSVSTQPSSASIVSGGADLTFVVRCTPSGTGSRTARISIANNDATEDPYTFDLECNGISPEIDVQRPAGAANTIADGGTDAIGNQAPTTIHLTYTVDNTAGTEQLDISSISATAYVNTSNFNLISTTPINIAAGASESFDFSFDVDAQVAFRLDLEIDNNDLDEDPYDFQISGMGAAIPEIDVQGNSTSILNGDTTPSATDHSDFGDVDATAGSVTRTFTIKNTGLADLDLTGGPPRVAISGTHAADFTLDTDANAFVSAGDETTFTITFDPGALGKRDATVSIDNNDGDEAPFDFSIQGTGTTPAPEMVVLGAGVSIPAGDTTPDVSDDTDFGAVAVDGGLETHIFTIRNTGSVDLNLTDNPRVTISGPDAADFSLDVDAAALVPANGGESGFAVSFNPSAVGLRQATISIANDDSDENPYTFDIQGVGESLGGGSAGSPDDEQAERGCFIGQLGGICKLGPVEVIISANTVPDISQVIIKEVFAVSDSVAADFKLGERVFDIKIKGPGGNWLTHFAIPIEIHFRPTQADLARVANNYALLNIYHNHDRGRWSALISVKAEDGCMRAFTDQLSHFALGVPQVPETGFAPNVDVELPEQPEEKTYDYVIANPAGVKQSQHKVGDRFASARDDSFVLEIPTLDLELPIVGVPLTSDGWDITWLDNEIGYLYSTAFPTWAGNTALTAHVWNADNTPGPFVDLYTLQHGDQISIKAWGQDHVYEVRATQVVRSDDLSFLHHTEYDTLTLITCKDFDQTSGEYDRRLAVTAVLVDVVDDRE